MSTTPVIPAPTFDWKSLLSVIELAANTAIGVLIPGGVAWAPLLASLENSVNPLLQTIGTKPSVSSEIMTVYGTVIGILTTLKAQPNLPSATLTLIDQYLIAAQNGTSSYLLTSQGFDPSQFQPVTPIS